jgi:predicted nucleic acid-binding protein
LTLVVDASVAIPACLAAGGFRVLLDQDLVAPPLMWSETRSALHELVWRGEVSDDDGMAASEALAACPVRRVEPIRLGSEAWRIADELGWAKTYDAEYVALAVLLGCRVVTLDSRLLRGAERLGVVVAPDQLG